MVFKMRILFFSKTGNAELMAQAIQREQKAGCDKIPPAYPCESEKLLFIGIESDKKVAPKEVLEFCNNLNVQRAKNVVFFAMGPSFEALDELKAIVRKKGVNVIDKPYLCTLTGGLFKKPKVSEEDMRGAAKWSADIVKSLLS